MTYHSNTSHRHPPGYFWEALLCSYQLTARCFPHGFSSANLLAGALKPEVIPVLNCCIDRYFWIIWYMKLFNICSSKQGILGMKEALHNGVCTLLFLLHNVLKQLFYGKNCPSPIGVMSMTRPAERMGIAHGYYICQMKHEYHYYFEGSQYIYFNSLGYIFFPDLLRYIIDMQHRVSLRYMTCWFDTLTYGKMTKRLPP